MATEREQFDAWFTKRWPEFSHPDASAFEAWQAGRAAERAAIYGAEQAQIDASLRAKLREVETHNAELLQRTLTMREALRRVEVSHTGMSYGDEKHGGPCNYTKGWGDCLAALKAQDTQVKGEAMNEIDVGKLEGAELDAAVAVALGHRLVGMAKTGHLVEWTDYSTDWALGGPIIERERINLRFDIPPDLYNEYGDQPPYPVAWFARSRGIDVEGPTPLIAAMRAFVASKGK